MPFCLIEWGKWARGSITHMVLCLHTLYLLQSNQKELFDCKLKNILSKVGCCSVRVPHWHLTLLAYLIPLLLSGCFLSWISWVRCVINCLVNSCHDFDTSISCFTSHLGTRNIVRCQSKVNYISTNQTLFEPSSQHNNSQTIRQSSNATAHSLFSDCASILPRLYLDTSCPAIAVALQWNLVFFKGREDKYHLVYYEPLKPRSADLVNRIIHFSFTWSCWKLCTPQ